MSGIIEIKDLSFSYTSKRKILKNLSFDVKSGTFMIIAGPNGAGKSTLLNLICGILKTDSGTIKIDQISLESYNSRDLAEKVAVVRQESVPVFGFTVIETVLMARTPHYSSIGFESKNDKEIAYQALEVTDTAQFASRTLASLSGGERQRVYIARALAQNSPILLLDEPTNFLDLKHQVGIYDLLKSAQLDKNKTVIAVTHELNLASQYCEDILLIGPDGICQHGSSKDILSSEQIQKVFDVEVSTGQIGQETFFIPKGKLSKNHNPSL